MIFQDQTLFILWAALNGVHINTGFHVLAHLKEKAKSKTSIIAIGDIATALASSLELRNLLPLMPILYEGRCLNLASYI